MSANRSASEQYIIDQLEKAQKEIEKLKKQNEQYKKKIEQLKKQIPAETKPKKTTKKTVKKTKVQQEEEYEQQLAALDDPISDETDNTVQYETDQQALIQQLQAQIAQLKK